MSAILILIFFSLLVAVGFLLAYLWAVKDGQFDDKYTPSMRILFDNGVKKQNTPAGEIKNKDRKTEEIKKS